jgi:HlyD family secretion protein
MLKRLIILFIIVAVVGGGVYLKLSSSAKNGEKNGIKLVKIERGDIIEKALAIGRIEPKKEIAVKSQISGIVKQVFVEVGDKVRPGDPLLEVMPDPTPLEFAEAKRNVELAAVSLERAETEYERTKQMRDSKLVSEKEFDEAENDYKQYKLRQSVAQERLALIEKGRTKIADRQIDTVIKASVDGTVLERHVNEGDPVVPLTSYQEGTELLLMAEMSDLIFKGTVDEIDVGKLSEGMAADLQIGAIPDQKITGRLSRISPKAQQKENATLFDVEIEITERGEKIIRAGYSTNASLVIRKVENVLFIPERLVEFRDGKTFVEVESAPGVYEKKEVKLGLSDGLNVEVAEGLVEGAEIVERPPKEIK